MSGKTRIIVATRNEGKLKEIEAMLRSQGLEAVSFRDFPNWPEIEESSDSYAANTYLKAKSLCELFDLPALADDSGLEVSFLGGKPGPMSSRYAGQDATDEMNMQKLLDEMRSCPDSERHAKFRCVACLVFPDGRVSFASGTVAGRIAHAPSGKGGFGYDPIFIPEGLNKTMAELTLEEKNAISHRAKAIRLVLRVSRL